MRFPTSPKRKKADNICINAEVISLKSGFGNWHKMHQLSRENFIPYM